MNGKFDGVLNNGKDFNMSKICSCNKNMTEELWKILFMR